MLLSNAVNRRKTNTLYFRSEKLPVLFSDMSLNLVSGTKNLEESTEAQVVKGKRSVHTAGGGRSVVDERGAWRAGTGALSGVKGPALKTLRKHQAFP